MYNVFYNAFCRFASRLRSDERLVMRQASPQSANAYNRRNPSPLEMFRLKLFMKSYAERFCTRPSFHIAPYKYAGKREHFTGAIVITPVAIEALSERIGRNERNDRYGVLRSRTPSTLGSGAAGLPSKRNRLCRPFQTVTGALEPCSRRKTPA